MRLWAIVLSIIFAVMIINPAVADRRLAHHHPYNYHQGYKHYYGPRRHFRYDHGHFAAYVLGGLIIGGILSAVINNSYNTDTWHPCPGSYGYTSELPQKDYDKFINHMTSWLSDEAAEPEEDSAED